MRGDPLRMILKAEAPVHEACQVRTVGQAVWHHQLVLQEQEICYVASIKGGRKVR